MKLSGRGRAGPSQNFAAFRVKTTANFFAFPMKLWGAQRSSRGTVSRVSGARVQIQELIYARQL